VNHPEEVVWVTFPACDDSARIMEPGKQTLDLPPATVTSERAAILRARAAVRSIGRNQLNPEVIAQMAIERVAVVTAIGDQARRKRAEEALRKRGIDERGFAGRSAGHVHGERKTMAVADRHDLAPFPAARRTDGSAPFFAELKLASIKASVRSSLPRSRRSSASRRSRRRSSPVRCHA
jgi:hypothetical protein